MNHSLWAYLERTPTEKLEEFLRWCRETGQEKNYEYVIPFIRGVLNRRREEKNGT